jgi:hypothetical protein
MKSDVRGAAADLALDSYRRDYRMLEAKVRRLAEVLNQPIEAVWKEVKKPPRFKSTEVETGEDKPPKKKGPPRKK